MLAHCGVLLGEFARPTLGVLRQPVEDVTISIARATGYAVFLVGLRLVGMMNSCWLGRGVYRGAGSQPGNDSIRGTKAVWSWNSDAGTVDEGKPGHVEGGGRRGWRRAGRRS
jgi:Magnesium chelatase, subunit ChlI